jgi:hypothetical protein
MILDFITSSLHPACNGCNYMRLHPYYMQTMMLMGSHSDDASAKWAVHIYYQYAKSEHGTIMHIVFGVCILFCILKDIYAE